MRKRFLYGSAVVLLAICTILVVWQGSFNFGELGPANPNQTLILWAVSTLIFLLMVTLGFILVRTGLKLYVERRSNRAGSRIKTKLVLGALALSFMPVFFLVLFSIEVLNANLNKWFSQPAEGVRLNFVEIARTLERETYEKLQAQAAWLASRPEVLEALAAGQPKPGVIETLCIQQQWTSASLLTPSGNRLDGCGISQTGVGNVMVRFPVEARGQIIGLIDLGSKLPLDVDAISRDIGKHIRSYDQLASERKNIRWAYILFLALIALFILFFATWIALFLAKQISVPIEALLRAAGEVRRGNLTHRVQVTAMDELADLVRGFNQMTQDLDANSRELDARRRFTEAILESIPTGVISLSADGSIERVNRALKKILPKEMVERAARLEDLFSREDTAEIKYLMKRARRTGLASREMELKTERQTLHLAVTVSALEEKLTSGFVVVLEDTSELLRAQKAAAWNEVARRVAHEIKNPLTPIALSAERISRQLERVALPRDVQRIVRECTATIAKEVESVKTLTDEFAQFARFPAAQPVRCDLNEVVESALAVFSGRLDGIQMQVKLAPALSPVNIDREQFKRAIVNLIDNAAEAMQDSLVKQLYIGTRAGTADSVELIVADTGCGVTAEDKEKLFLPYFSTKGRGTGLGLAIVNHILSDHNAQVRVEDNLPAGTRFTIEVPAIELVEIEPKAVGIRA